MQGLESLGYALGVLGAYFAVLLVLSVAVETILDPITLFKGLRKKVSPDKLMEDLEEWLPEGSPGGTQAAAIANLAEEFSVKTADIKARVKEINAIAVDTSKALGTGAAAIVTDVQMQVAAMMSAIRNKYDLDRRKRIAILRTLSAIIGIVLALVLQIDTFEMLADLFPEDAQAFLSSTIAHFGGIVLTGLAASAGSSFWHDQLGKVRALKEAQQKIKEVAK